MRSRERANELKWYRADITGLRAIAIVPVVAFHAGVDALPGGFVGVDVFYVISGFLITTMLVREVESTGRIALATFWARRVLRLVPALALVVLVTLPVAMLLTSVFGWGALGAAALSSLAYVSNFYFARQATDYFGDAVVPSPFLHTWSLGVEEQFYLLWPFVILICAGLVHRRMGLRLGAIRAGLAVVALTSFALSVIATPIAPLYAFYLLPTRAWEFAVAGLVATVPLDRWVRRRGMRSTVAAGGLALIGASVLLIRESDTFPGWLAAVPVLGALLVIVGGSAPSRGEQGAVSAALAWRPIEWLGQVSYSWYLWHWPFIVVALLVFPDSLPATLAAGLLSLVAAAVTYRYVENPIRFSVRLRASRRRTFAFGGGLTVAVAGIAVLAVVAGPAVATQPAFAAFASARELPSQNCDEQVFTSVGPVCVFGSAESPRTLMLIGDSHAGQWAPALDRVAEANDVRLLVRWVPACPVSGLATVTFAGAVSDCARQRASLAAAAELAPDAVILAQAATYENRLLAADGSPILDDSQFVLWEEAYDEALEAYLEVTPRVGVIMDNPRLGFDPIDCNTRILRPSECSEDREVALARNAPLFDAVARVSASHPLTALFDPTDRICDDRACYTVDAAGPIYSDFNHLAQGWTVEQSDGLDRLVDALMADTARLAGSESADQDP